MITLVFLYLFIMYFYALVLTCIHTLNTSTRYFSHPCHDVESCEPWFSNQKCCTFGTQVHAVNDQSPVNLGHLFSKNEWTPTS